MTPRYNADSSRNPGRSRKQRGRRGTAPPENKSEQLVSRRRFRPVRFVARLLLLVGIWLVIAMVGLLAYEATQLPDISNLDRVTRRGGVQLLAVDGSEFASFGAVHGRPVTLSQLPEHMIDALLATEDRRFFDHFGVDFQAVIRAAYTNIRHGGIRQGGSTLTQQLAKNLFLSADRNFERKVQELLLSFWLEASFSKEQILTIYLNRVYFGAGAYGVAAAAQKYFRKSPTHLTLYESALLVGLLKAPSRYNPGVSPARAADRARQILMNMVDAGLVDRRDTEIAQATPPPIRGSAGVSRGYRHFADWVLDRTAGYTGRGGDRTIATTLDRRLQNLAEAAIREGLSEDPRLETVDAAMIAMTADGAILAMVGGRDYAVSKFNRATQALRQPGSAFKPFVYLAALDAGYEPDSIVRDAPVVVNGWSPRNFDGRFRGPVTLREALAHSLNAATVRLSEDMGRHRTLALVRQLGITAALNDTPSLALGVGEVTLLELTGAYAAFANAGYPVEPHGVVSVGTTEGNEIYRHRLPRTPAVASRETLDKLTSMLRDVLRFGTGRQAAIGSLAAGKTGTSQNYRDAWFVGYVDKLVAGVWVGYDDARPMDGVTGGNAPARIWASFMQSAF